MDGCPIHGALGWATAPVARSSPHVCLWQVAFNITSFSRSQQSRYGVIIGARPQFFRLSSDFVHDDSAPPPLSARVRQNFPQGENGIVPKHSGPFVCTEALGSQIPPPPPPHSSTSRHATYRHSPRRAFNIAITSSVMLPDHCAPWTLSLRSYGPRTLCTCNTMPLPSVFRLLTLSHPDLSVSFSGSFHPHGCRPTTAGWRRLDTSPPTRGVLCTS